jgi:predicted nucleic acid-binding protein
VPFVLDASVAGCWFFDDETDIRATTAWNRLEQDRAIVPLQWWFEVRNICLLGERRGRVTEAQTEEFVRELSRFAIDFDSLPDQGAVMAVARRHQLTVYDAAYLELAQRGGIALATLDRKLAIAARAEDVALIAD